MEENELCVTTQDHARLCRYLAEAGQRDPKAEEALRLLAEELCGRRLVDQREIGPEVVTMHSRVLLRDIATKEDLALTLVYPDDADLREGKLSVATPLGAALLGSARGAVLEWRPSPRRLRRLLVKAVMFQPEAAGNYSL